MCYEILRFEIRFVRWFSNVTKNLRQAFAWLQLKIVEFDISKKLVKLMAWTSWFTANLIAPIISNQRYEM